MINTINGEVQWIIEKSYGLLELQYDENNGWIVVKESTLDVGVDDITIEESASQVVANDVITTGTDAIDWFRNTSVPFSDAAEWSVYGASTFTTFNTFNSFDDGGWEMLEFDRTSNGTIYIWDIGVLSYY